MGVSRASNLTIALKTGGPLAAGAAELRDPARSLNFGRAASRFIDLRRLCRLIAAFLHCGRRLALLAPEAGAGPRAEQRAARRQAAMPRHGSLDGRARAAMVLFALTTLTTISPALAGCPGAYFGTGQSVIAQDYVSPDGKPASAGVASAAAAAAAAAVPA